jgi:hypothetical protein
MTTKRQGGILEQWWVWRTVGDNLIIVGTIYGDPEWPSGRHIRTSTVERVEGGKVYTRNTVYRLGARTKENVE